MTAATLAVWSAQKIVPLTGHRHHKHAPNPVAPDFQAPAPAASISFGPTALAAAMARTATLLNAPPVLLSRLKDSALNDAEILIADGPVFGLTSYIASLADTERTHFAARVGAGITDLYMNGLGYVWRDNAVCLASTLNPHADFLYAGGNASGYGVVLAEAHGSFAGSVTDSKLAAQARNKYLRQVRPFIAKPSPYGEVIHGYSVAFGSRPGTVGAFLRLSETLRRKPRRSPPPPSQRLMGAGGRPPTQIALASYRSNFVLMDALPVADWIDWTRGLRELPADIEPLAFFRLEYAGRAFLAYAHSLSLFRPPFVLMDNVVDHPLWRHRWRRLADQPLSIRWFVIEEKIGERFLNALSALIRLEDRILPETLDLPSGDFVGSSADGAASITRRDGVPYEYALFRDGLALLGGPSPRHITGHRIWHPKHGLE
ncbi:hypothetical protein [Bradyrhizobium sp. B117]|uniref:hypothetical protein n=1 Tax=Bradyrhizobium sp. B117 TaxID=3140246 RepID=UPI0031843A3D